MTDNMEMREVYCQALIDAAKNDSRIVVVEADLMNCIKTGPFRSAPPALSIRDCFRSRRSTGTLWAKKSGKPAGW